MQLGGIVLPPSSSAPRCPIGPIGGKSLENGESLQGPDETKQCPACRSSARFSVPAAASAGRSLRQPSQAIRLLDRGGTNDRTPLRAHAMGRPAAGEVPSVRAVVPRGVPNPSAVSGHHPQCRQGRRGAGTAAFGPREIPGGRPGGAHSSQVRTKLLQPARGNGRTRSKLTIYFLSDADQGLAARKARRPSRRHGQVCGRPIAPIRSRSGALDPA